MQDFEKMRLTADEYIDKNFHLSIQNKVHTGKYPMHCHDYFEIEFIVDGKGTQVFNGITYELSNGSFYMLSPADFHSINTNTEIKLCTIAFDDSLIVSKFLQLLLFKKNIIFKLSQEDLMTVIRISEIISLEQQNIKQYSRDFVQNLLDCLFIIMLRYLNVSEKSFNPEVTPVSKVITYLNIHFRESPSLPDVSAIAGMSSGYFSVLFSKTIGKSYIDYLTDLKLNCAKTLLSSESMSVSDICYACGFSSFSNFFRAFKKETGLSPRDYRKNAANTY